jgi:hypothetical protein
VLFPGHLRSDPLGATILDKLLAVITLVSTNRCPNSVSTVTEHLGHSDDFSEKLHRNIGFDQSVAVLGKGGRVPNRLIQGKTHKPPKQHID